METGTEQKNLFRGQCFRPGSTPAAAKQIALLKDERCDGQAAARAEEPLNFCRDDGQGVEIWKIYCYTRFEMLQATCRLLLATGEV